MKEKVLLGMSGGVDSAVSALLLQKQGYEVIGVTMLLYNKEENEDVKKLVKKLNIEHYFLDYTSEFKENVIDSFAQAYSNSITPNPCIECNKFLKFGLMFKDAERLGCKYIATGHYAQIQYSDKYNRLMIVKANSEAKDQSYVLYNIDKDNLSKVIFPLGEFSSKEEIRKIAEENDLIVAHKKDSQEICFIPDDDYVKYLIEQYDIKEIPGDIVDIDGNIMGKHKGLIHYTIGQRRGMGMANKVPYYVIGINKEKNQIIVGEEKDTYAKELLVNECNFLIDNITDNRKVHVKIRYSAKPASASILNADGKIKVIFDEPQKFVTPGQSAVFYDGNVLLGGGKIIIID